MPEGDSIFQLAHRLQWMVGRQVVKSQFRVPTYAQASVTGLQCTRVWSYGKHLFMQFEQLIVQTHLKMDGSWTMHRVGDRWPKPAHTARVVLQLHDPAGPIELIGWQLGVVKLFPATEYHQQIAYLGPDILGDDWNTSGQLRAKQNLLREPTRLIATALLDQRNLAGIGNEYRSEILFLAKVHPATTVQDAPVDDILQLSRRLLWANRFSSIRVTTGVRRAGATTYVYGRDRQACRRCGATILVDDCSDSAALGRPAQPARFIWWCPTCQPNAAS
ncbi:DNA-formamidopyrimidine glycosylase family protein [Corynebacterium sp. HS2168-gen11]|uniref:DNA-formamidopyrimidine glycosylase family protein n=1 Tax=Corynebacterium sp. HS2168-gen11 TaxID=2974027 RepID=UPI00216B0F87|nr:DNA-formamidopyrimidine glycosylase family protein [Corynebacterium sp. HS2168-gen11]MCS4536418.1 Fpg/Nei family DNA glycosylase [Corynebacterium sp. HS2168-gen11]